MADLNRRPRHVCPLFDLRAIDDPPFFEGEQLVPSVDFVPGGYRYIPAVFQYSGGVSALPGMAIQRFQFSMPVPLVEGVDRIRRIIEKAGRPLTSICACELRSPAPFTEQGFRAFNL